LLVILTPQDMTDPTQHRRAVAPGRFFKLGRKPVLASWMGGADVAAGVSILNRASIPTFPYPDTAAQVFNYMWHYTYNLKASTRRRRCRSPAMPRRWTAPAPAIDRRGAREGAHDPHRIRIQADLQRLRHSHRGDAPGRHCRRRSARGESIGYPVVLKLNSETITHKTDVKGVQFNLQNEAVRDAFEPSATQPSPNTAPSTSRASPCSRWSNWTATS
jgi:acetyltransferase